MNLLIVGCGMYVTGRHGTGVGTVLTSAMQKLGDDQRHSITVCATAAENALVVSEAAARIRKSLGMSRAVNYIAYDGTGPGLGRLAQTSNIDVAIVSTPDHLHFDQVRTLIDLGIHCLCVKPLVPTTAQHATLVALAYQRSVYGAIEFHKRWDESNLFARKMVREHQLGRLHNISVDYSQRLLIPCEVFSKWVKYTNIFQYLGVHYVDLVLWLTDAVPIRLCCRGTSGALKERGIETWDSVHVWLISRNENGTEFLTQFNLSWIDSNQSPALSDQRFWILGSAGRLELDQRNRGIAATLHDQPMQYINPWFSEILPTPDDRLEMQGYGYRSIAQFLSDASAILNGERTARSLIGSRPTFQDCLNSTRVVEAVNNCLVENYNDFIAI